MFGERLKRARIKAGLSLEALSIKADKIVTKQAISQYEKDQKVPSSTVLVALAKALEVKLDYFFRNISVEIGQVDFRKHSSFGKKQQESLKEKVREELERYIELEEILDYENGFINHLENISIRSYEDAEKAADELRNKWDLGHDAITNVMQMLELRDIKVIYIEEESKRFNGLCGLATNVNHPFVVLNSNEELPLDRKRFTACHELGHLLLENNIVDEDLDHERVANRFAGAFLLPENIIKKEIGEKRTSIALQEVVALKQKYKISIQAIMYRLKDLNIISESKYKSFAISNRKNKYDENNPLDKSIENINRFDNMLARAVSEELISISKYAELAGININDAEEKIGVTL